MGSCSEGVTQIHNVRFYNLGPRSINCLAYNQQKHKLAVSRGDASIEVWDMSFAPFLEKVIAGAINTSVEGLGWFGERLFSAGLSGALIEWNLISLQPKVSQLVTGSAVWCMDINVNEGIMALGTEEGYVNVFDISEQTLEYGKVFDKQEGRILCCKFDKSGHYVVTGSQDVIRIWDTKTGHAIHKMTMSRNELKRETIVWSLQVMRDFTIIAGDSRGQVTFWDGKLGVQVESHQVLKADLLAIALNDDEDMLICSGIEPIIRIYALTTIKTINKSKKNWVKYLQRCVHDHDVKALICVGERIISGGVDGYLGISSYSKLDSTIEKYGPFLQHPCATVAKQARLILCRYCNYLEIWNLGKAKDKTQIIDNDNKSIKLLGLEKGPRKMLEFRSRHDEPIICSTLSSNGKWLVYSTPKKMQIFSISLKTSDDTMKLTPIKDIPEQFLPSLKIIFSSDSQTLFCVNYNNGIDIFNILPNDEIDHVDTIDVTKYFKDVIHLIEISQCKRYLVLAGICRTIAVWKKKNKSWEYYVKLPKYISITTAIGIHCNRPTLIAAFSDGKIFEYDLEEMCFTCSTMEKFVANSYTHCINGIVLDSRNEDAIILHNDTYLFVLKKCEKIQKSNSIKMAKTIQDNSMYKLELKFNKTYEHLVHLDFLGENEMVAIGVNPVALVEQLPSSLRQKKFGAA